MVLLILDGWGHSKQAEHNAIAAAHKPVWDRLWSQCPHTLIRTSGAAVGLPADQMGNSEVGHLNLGAGRVVYQEFTRVSRAIKTGSFFTNLTLTDAVDAAKDNDKAVHILGLLSPGGVHSHEDHIHAMVELAVERGADRVYLHAFLDGRDTPPRSAGASIEAMQAVFDRLQGGRFASITGRYYAMDRDLHWERIQQAYDLITQGEANYMEPTARAALEAAISDRTRAIFYASPSNPTGIAFEREELEFIADLAKRNDLWIVADEVYGDFVFDGEFCATAAVDGIEDRLITIGSLSKSYAMSGWRLGWAVAPEPMIDHLEKLALCMLYGLPGFIQQAGAEALTHCGEDLRRMAEIYRQRRDYLYATLDAMPGLKPLLPDAGMFMMVDVRGTGLAVSDFTHRLYQATGVSVLDASAFGASAAGHVRVSCTVSDDELREACRRIAEFLETL